MESKYRGPCAMHDDHAWSSIIEVDPMWLSKPLYESLPLSYVALGIAALLAGLYIDYWHWALICTAVGVTSLVGGLAVLLKRRGYRSSRSRIDFEKTE